MLAANFPTFFRFLALSALALTLLGCNLTIYKTGSGNIEFSSADFESCANNFANCTSWSMQDEVELTAVPAPGYRFYGWEGDCTGQGSCSLKMNNHRNVRAVFLAGEPIYPAPEFKPNTDHFFSAPWPNDAYSRDANGRVDITEFPFKKGTKWEKDLKKLAKETRGFSTNGGVFFQMAIDYSVDDYIVQSYQARFYNADKNSDQFGQSVPAMVKYYRDQEAATAAIEANSLLVAVPVPGYSLAPNTTYLVGLYNPLIQTTPVGLIAQLDADYTGDSNIPEALFNELKQQKQQLKTIDSREPLAFTSFTTQDPKAIDIAIGKTLRQFDAEAILDSVQSIELKHGCVSEQLTENFILHTQVPRLQKGKRPFLLSGGGIDVDVGDGKAIIQGYETLQLLLKIPCEPVPENGFPLIIHASETLLDWTEQFVDTGYGNRRAIEILISAPESKSRSSTFIEVLANLMETFEVDYWVQQGIMGTITDFNVLNLESAKYSYMQYGAEVYYTQMVAQYLKELLPNHERLKVAENQMVLSGDSGGAIALLHARAMGAHADMIISSQAPRPSYIHIGSIVNFEGLPVGFVDFVSDLSGINLENNRYQPLSHIVQTVLEPMDTLNYVEELRVTELFYALSDIKDPLHGGEAAFSMATALENQIGMRPLFKESSIGYGELADFMDIGDYLTFESFGSSNAQRLLTVYDYYILEREWLLEWAPFHGARCFAFDVYRRGRPFDGINFTPYDSDAMPNLCNE